MTIPASTIFGSNVSVDVTTPTLPLLVINLKDFEDTANGGEITGGVGIDDVTVINTANLDDHASSILTAILIMHQQKQPTDNTVDTNGTYINFDTNFNKAFVTRNSVGQIRYDYTVQVFVPDSVSALDPDSVV